MRRREFVGVLGGAVVWPTVVLAQQATMPLVGFLGSTSPNEYAYLTAAFRRGLNEVGYIEGQNLAIEYRWADNRSDRLRALAADLVSRNVAAIMTSGDTAPTVAARAATSTIPIVFAFGSDPVRAGLVASINRPEGNVTGVSFITTLLGNKRLDLLRELIPKAVSVGVLVNPKTLEASAMSAEMQEGSRILGLQLHLLSVTDARDFDAAFVSLAEKRIDTLLVAADQLFNAGRRKLVTLASQHANPAVFIQRQFVIEGGLMSYGPSLTDSYHQAAIYIGRILKGAKPADLPILLPTKYELVINLKTAKSLGLEISPTLLARADEVIE